MCLYSSFGFLSLDADVLQRMGLRGGQGSRSVPPGVISVPSGVILTSRARLAAPILSLLPSTSKHTPAPTHVDLAMLVSLRLHRRNSAFLFSIFSGSRLQLGLELSPGQLTIHAGAPSPTSAPTRSQAQAGTGTNTVSFPLDLHDGRWHSLALSVSGRRVTLQVGCGQRIQTLLFPVEPAPLDRHGSFQLGRGGARLSGVALEGALCQLDLVSWERATNVKYCSTMRPECKDDSAFSNHTHPLLPLPSLSDEPLPWKAPRLTGTVATTLVSPSSRGPTQRTQTVAPTRTQTPRTPRPTEKKATLKPTTRAKPSSAKPTAPKSTPPKPSKKPLPTKPAVTKASTKKPTPPKPTLKRPTAPKPTVRKPTAQALPALKPTPKKAPARKPTASTLSSKPTKRTEEAVPTSRTPARKNQRMAVTPSTPRVTLESTPTLAMDQFVTYHPDLSDILLLPGPPGLKGEPGFPVRYFSVCVLPVHVFMCVSHCAFYPNTS